MIIAFTAQQPQIESSVDPRFGRAPYFILVDAETSKWEACINPAVNQSGGAGVAAAQFVINKKADAVISGDFGPNASKALNEAHIKMNMYTGEISSVKEAVDLYRQGNLPRFE